MMLFAFIAGMSPSPAQALLRKKKKPNRAIDDYSERLVTLAWPIAQNLGFSGAVGFLSAFALKVRDQEHIAFARQDNWYPKGMEKSEFVPLQVQAVGSALALAFGALFVLIQVIFLKATVAEIAAFAA